MPHTNNVRQEFLHNCRHHLLHLINLEDMGGTFSSVYLLVPQLVLTSGEADVVPLDTGGFFLVEEVCYWTRLYREMDLSLSLRPLILWRFSKGLQQV